MLFLESQARFIIPWSLVILIIVLLFNIFGCTPTLDAADTASNYYMDYAGCCLYSVVILLTNLNYSVLCNIKGDFPLLIFYEIVLFAEIIYNGTLLIRFIDELKDNPKAKDYSILFVSIFIAWQILVMDLLFRGAYEDKQKHKKHHELHRMVVEHRDVCDAFKKSTLPESSRQLQLNDEEIDEPE
jgi:hypothetical protein